MCPVSGGGLPTVEDRQDTIFLLSAPVDLEDWNVLTDEQKEILADAIAAPGARSDAAEDPGRGDELAFGPEPCWWRDQGMSQELAS